MSTIDEQMLSGVIRKVNPQDFSLTAHQPAWEVVLDVSNRQPVVAESKEKSFWQSLFGSRKNDNLVHYCVKKTSKPVVFKAVDFHWVEGASHLELSFKGVFSLAVNTREEAEGLVLALYHPLGCGHALYNLIDKHLHLLMKKVSSELDSGSSILQYFDTADSGLGRSDKLDALLSEAVTSALGKETGKADFRIGLTLADLPSQELYVETETAFSLLDSDHPWIMKTTAKLELNNYQNYKNAELHGGDDVRRKMESYIEAAVKKHIFGKDYFGLIDQFFPGPDVDEHLSISTVIEKEILARANTLGYRAKPFHTMANIPLLALQNGVSMAFEDDDVTFQTKSSTGEVQLQVEAVIRAENFSKVKRLFKPEDDTLEPILRAAVRKKIQQYLRSVTLGDFNLGFEVTVKPNLEDSLRETFAENYGLVFDDLAIIEQTEDLERLRMLCAERRTIQLKFYAQADGGGSETVVYNCSFKVVELADDGWAEFVKTDYGFRKQSSKRLRLNAEIAGDVNDADLHIKLFAIERELDDIEDNIKKNIQEEFSKINDLAAISRRSDGSRELRSKIQSYTDYYVRRDFGLKVAIVALERDNTAVEWANIDKQEHGIQQEEQIRESQRDELADRIAHGKDIRREIHKKKLKEIPGAVEDAIHDRDINPLDMPETAVDSVVKQAEKEMTVVTRVDNKTNLQHLPETPDLDA